MIFSKRKWGWYLTLASGKHWKIKLLWFRKGGAISLQKHFRRNELWIFLLGNGHMKTYFSPDRDKNFHRERGDFHYIPSHWWHQYTAEKRTLVLEIQTGICKEEDIIREV